MKISTLTFAENNYCSQGRRKDFNGGLIGGWGVERASGKTGAKKALEEVERASKAA